MKNGDVVQLKSGGPTMTILDIVGNIVTVTWFDHFNAIKEAKFPVETLQVISKEVKQAPSTRSNNPNDW